MGPSRDSQHSSRTRDEVSGARSGPQSDGAAVTLLVELLSFGAMISEHTSVLVPV